MKYFAYGSNMDPRQMRQRVGCDIRRRTWARLDGYKLVFNKRSFSRPGSAAANVVKCSQSRVEGVLYEIDRPMRDRLDAFEGCPNHYERRQIRVANKSGELVEGVWLYIAVNPRVLAEGLRPFPEYLERLLAGGAAEQNAKKLLSEPYLAQLRRVPTFAPENRCYRPPLPALENA